MGDIDIEPPAAPGTQQRKKKGLFSRFFKKDTLDDVRVTEDAFTEEMSLDEIRQKAGIDAAPVEERSEVAEQAPEEAPVVELPAKIEQQIATSGSEQTSESEPLPEDLVTSDETSMLDSPKELAQLIEDPLPEQ